MNELNYLGSGTSGGMPAAVPGASQNLPLMGAIRGSAPVSPESMGAIRSANDFTGFPAQQGESMPEYSSVTQEDGSILLHIKNADGSLGPVVKIVNPIKPRKV